MNDRPIVTLLDYSSRNEENVATAGRACYSKRVPAEIYGDFILNESSCNKQIRKLMDAHHYSTAEHTFYMFSVENISRAATHQLVRHRHLSYEQQSQRYAEVNTKNTNWYITPANLKGEQLYHFQEAMKNAATAYEFMLEAGAKPEDARAVLPNATKTSIIVSGNARAFYEMLTLRMCRSAQYEIRMMAYDMAKQLKKFNPTIFQDVGPTCTRGYCNEPDGPSCPQYSIVKNPVKEVIDLRKAKQTENEA